MRTQSCPSTWSCGGRARHGTGRAVILRVIDGDALGDRDVVLVVAAAMDGAALGAVRRAGLRAPRGPLELVRAGVEADAADGERGDELGDVVELALEGAVSELERLLDVPLADRLVQELGLLALGRLGEIRDPKLGVAERTVLTSGNEKMEEAEEEAWWLTFVRC